MTRRIIQPKDRLITEVKKTQDRSGDSSRTDRVAGANGCPFFPYGGSAAPTSLWSIACNDTSPFTDHTQGMQPWVANVYMLYRRGIKCTVPWSTDGGTVGHLRLWFRISGVDYNTDTVTLPAGTYGSQDFAWVHSGPFRTSTNMWVIVECRRASGAGSIYIQMPVGGLQQVPPTGCSSTGV